MRILFTGASSFTGVWFVRELARAGHDVVATFRRKPEDYPDALRRERVRLAVQSCRPVFGASFGDEAFLELAGQGGFDLLAHHAADVTNYKSPDFDVCGALAANTRNLGPILRVLHAGGCRRVLLTGTFFEGGEGAGSQGLPDFSAYGLSKALTAQLFRYICARAGMGLGKFVVPNPFGPWEEPRFTAYLIKSWFAGQTPSCATPLYVRDNIHVSLLARAYAQFAAEVPASGMVKRNPSGYPETQGAFTLRFAAEMRGRLELPCPVELKKQVDFPEPRVRINTEVLDAAALGWDEAEAWDELAAYYRRAAGK